MAETSESFGLDVAGMDNSLQDFGRAFAGFDVGYFPRTDGGNFNLIYLYGRGAVQKFLPDILRHISVLGSIQTSDFLDCHSGRGSLPR